VPIRRTRKVQRWDPPAGRCTRAYAEWQLGDREVRAFLKLGLRHSADGYEATWRRLSREPSDGEGPDLFDLMDQELDGLTSIQFDWLLVNMTLRDGVTLYELYLEMSSRKWRSASVSSQSASGRPTGRGSGRCSLQRLRSIHFRSGRPESFSCVTY
jgi:hypothetical protein